MEHHYSDYLPKNRYYNILLKRIRLSWAEILLRTKNNMGISDLLFEVTLSTTKVDTFIDGVLIILALDDIVMETLRGRYKPEIEKAIFETIGVHVPIEVGTLNWLPQKKNKK